MAPGSYYLFNFQTPAGFDRALGSYKIIVTEEGTVSINDEPYTPQNNTISMTMTFHPIPPLPTTGVFSGGAVQGVGAVAALGATIVIIRRVRRGCYYVP